MYVVQRMTELGVLIRYMPNGVYFYPPLVIEPVQIDAMVAAARQALIDAGARFESVR